MILFKSFHDFHAHAAVVVWTFPKTGFVVDMVRRSILVYAPKPLAVGMVYQMFFDEIFYEVSMVRPIFVKILLFILCNTMRPSGESAKKVSFMCPVLQTVTFFISFIPNFDAISEILRVLFSIKLH